MNKKNLPYPLSYKNGLLYFDQKRIDLLAKKVATPFYLYSEKTAIHSLSLFYDKAREYELVNPLVCFALKANSNLDLLKALASHNAGADIVSGGELVRALEAGIKPQKIVFSGVGKTEEEIALALKSSPKGIYSFNVESEEELNSIQNVAKRLKRKARVALRFNPQVVTKTHKHISTGHKTHKFGIVKKDILRILKKMKKMTHIEAVGLSMHIGSQLTCLKATKKALKELSEVVILAKMDFEFLDVGGGLGVDYKRDGKTISTIDEYMATISKTLTKELYPKLNPNFQKPRIIMEPGRFICAEAGVLVTKVIRTKKSDDCHFTIVDGGMNDFIRTSLYDAYHLVLPAKKKKGRKVLSNVVGPICETADKFAANIDLTSPQSNDILCICDTGAYGYSMASNYNLRKIPDEVVITSRGELITRKRNMSFLN